MASHSLTGKLYSPTYDEAGEVFPRRPLVSGEIALILADDWLIPSKHRGGESQAQASLGSGCSY